jgi:thiol-disulfide isomerase/thioredoxin
MLAAALAPLADLVRAQTQPTAPRSSGGGSAPLPVLGQPLRLPDEVVLLDDAVLRPVHERNKVLVLYWWASWCPFCAIQSPLMDKLWRAHRSAGLQLLGLSIDKKREEAIGHLRAKGYGYPSTWVTPEIEKMLPRPKGLPITVVLGRDGKVLMAEAGQLFPEDIEQIAHFL